MLGKSILAKVAVKKNLKIEPFKEKATNGETSIVPLSDTCHPGISPSNFFLMCTTI